MGVSEATFDDLAAVIAEHFRCDKAIITSETMAPDIYGWDSLEHTVVIMKVETRFDIELPDELIFTIKNVGELFELVQETLGHG